MSSTLSSLMLQSIRIGVIAAVLLSAGCGTIMKDGKGKPSSPTFSLKKKGGYYLDDGPGANPPADLHLVPDAIPRDEPLRAANMRPYAALGKRYTPRTSHKPYRERGIASWYGRRYHGQKTASGEVYDMYGMTAAHPVLPIPSYARVTHIGSGRSVVVRINDRGPFLSDRLIDLSYTAAYKLDVLSGGSARVEVEAILPNAIATMRTVSSSSQAGGSALAPASPAAPSPAPIREAAGLTPFAGGEWEDAEAGPELFQAAPASDVKTLSAPRAVSPSISNGEVIYLQLGAFSAYDNADNFLARMRAELPALIDSLEIVAKDGLFKVHAGPYADQAIAREAAEKIAQALSIRPMLLTR